MNETAPRLLPGRLSFVLPTFPLSSRRQRARLAPVQPIVSSIGSLRRKHLQLTERGGVCVARLCRRIAASSEEVSRLVIEPERLNRRDHRATTPARNQQRLFAHLPRQRASKRMLKELENLLRLAREQRLAESVQKRQHRDPVVFGVIYTL